jgi:putative phosphoesterase
MRIGLISDTHIPEVEDELPPQVIQVFQGVDLILHAGDIYATSVLDDLERLAPVLAALGDDDYARGDKRVKEKHILKLEGQTLWLVHMGPLYFSAGQWLSRGPSEPEKDSKPDIIVFGHEHRPLVQHSNGILYVNSGSPTLLNYRRGLGTIGMLDINSGKADVRIIQLQKSA